MTDPSSAVIPNAVVRVSGGGNAVNQKTDSQGRYTAPLSPGQYTVRVEASGFVTSEQQNVTVSSGQATALDISLQIVPQSQQVDV